MGEILSTLMHPDDFARVSQYHQQVMTEADGGRIF